MKKIIFWLIWLSLFFALGYWFVPFALGYWFVSKAKAATICSSVPYTFAPGQTIASAQMNANFAALISCINANAANAPINTNITSLTALTGSPFVPSGLIGYFDLSSCPAGWSLANGGGGTPDLRGYYFRSVNSGSGRDPNNPALGGTYNAAVGPVTGTVATTDSVSGSTGTGTAAVTGTGTGTFSGTGSGTATVTGTGPYITGFTAGNGGVAAATNQLIAQTASVGSSASVSTTDSGSISVTSLSANAAVPSLTVSATGTGSGTFTQTGGATQNVVLTVALTPCVKN